MTSEKVKMDVTPAFHAMTEIVGDLQIMLDAYVKERGQLDFRLKKFISMYHRLLSLSNEVIAMWIDEDTWEPRDPNGIPHTLNKAIDELRQEVTR